jgi:HK97 family phage major capsid protein
MEGVHASDFMPEEEYRVLSKGASGGGFLVPTDVSEMIIAAARAASAVAQVATEVVTERGETVGMALAGTHGTAVWTAESGSYTPSDETITQQNLGAFKAATKIIVSEELRSDEVVDLDAYLAFELGARIGVLENNAFTLGDGAGKPLGIVHASSPYTVVTAATGSATTFKLADLKAVFKLSRWPTAPKRCGRSTATILLSLPHWPTPQAASYCRACNSTRRACSAGPLCSTPTCLRRLQTRRAWLLATGSWPTGLDA